MSVEMEAIDSALISHRLHLADDHILKIRFRTRTEVPGSLYEYANVSPALYAEGLVYIDDKGKPSFGQWFNRTIKVDPKRHPFRKLEEVGGAPTIDSVIEKLEQTTDFASGQPIPATTPAAVEPIPEDEDALLKAALALQDKAKGIVINSPDAYGLAETTALAIARMRDALEKTMRPKITNLYAPYKAALAVLNLYDNPLELHQKNLKAGMSAYKRIEDQKAQAEANRIRQERQREEEEKARQRAEQLKLEDALEAESRGEVELAESIMEAPALPLQAAFVAPVHVTSSVPMSKDATHIPKWVFVYVDERGEPVDEPRLDLIPREYIKVDDKSIGSVVRTLKGRTNIPGIRAYDEGNVRFNLKG